MTTRGVGLLLAVLLGAWSAGAQTSGRDSSSRVEDSCTYIKCVLVISRSRQGDERLTIGSLGRSESLGFSGASVVRAVATVPLASSAARAGGRRRIAVRALVYPSLIAMGYLAMSRSITRTGPPVMSNFIGFAEGAGRGLLFVVPVTLVAIPIERSASRQFDRAVRVYNEQLPR